MITKGTALTLECTTLGALAGFVMAVGYAVFLYPLGW